MKLKLVKKVDEAAGTKSFYFESDKPIKYLPGQFFYITLPKLTQEEKTGPTRMFTASSSPTEKLLRFTTRMRDTSGFKHSLDGYSIGEMVEVEGPSGTFVIDKNEKGPHVYIAGGIGVTPAISIIQYISDKNLDTSIHLIYSNRKKEDIAFKKDLDKLAGKNIKVTYTLTEENDPNWKGETGRVDEKMIQKLVPETKLQNYWISGPSKMVTTIQDVLTKMGVPLKQIHTEGFSGY